MTYRRAPRKIPPKIKLLFCIPQAFGKLVIKFFRELIQCLVELLVRNHLIYKAPLKCYLCRNFLTKEKYFSRSPIPYYQRRELGGGGGGYAPPGCTYLPDINVARGYSKIA